MVNENNSSETLAQSGSSGHKGDIEAAEGITPSLYEELQKIAEAYLSEVETPSLIQAELVNEVIIRLIRQKKITWEDRKHFLGMSARIMRQILIEHVRKRKNQDSKKANALRGNNTFSTDYRST